MTDAADVLLALGLDHRRVGSGYDPRPLPRGEQARVFARCCADPCTLDDIVADVENARVWGGLHYRTTMTQSAKHFTQIARDVGRRHFLTGTKGHDDHYDDRHDKDP